VIISLRFFRLVDPPKFHLNWLIMVERNFVESNLLFETKYHKKIQ
jgi:hypothetical protein